MLPSKGFFNNFICPFNEFSVCERPHCHYRHFRKKKQKPEENGSGNASSMPANYSPEDLTSLLDSEIISEAVQNLLNKSNEGKKVLPGPLPLPTPQPESTPVPTYKPTPISELSRRHLPTLYVPSRAEPRKTKADGNSEQPLKKKRVQEYRPKPAKKPSVPAPEYCPSTIALPESQISALAEDLSFLDNIFDDKDLLESEIDLNQAFKLNADSKLDQVNVEPCFSSEDDANSDLDDITNTAQTQPEKVNGQEDAENHSTNYVDVLKLKKEPDDASNKKEDLRKIDKKAESKRKEDSSSKKNRSSHSRSKSSSSKHSSRRSVEKKESERKSHRSSSSRHKSSSRSRDHKSRHSRSSARSSRHRSSSSKNHSSKDRRSSSSSHSKRKSSSKKSSSNSRDKKYENHECNCKYCPTNKRHSKNSESESEASEQSESENEVSSGESVIYCSPERTKIVISSSSEEEKGNEEEDEAVENGSNSEPDNCMDNDPVPELSGESASSGDEGSVAKQVFAKFKEANFKATPLQTDSVTQSGSKKRIAHDSVANASSSWPQNNYNAPKIDNKKADSLTPSQLMAQRWEKIQQLKNAAPSNSTGPQPPVPGKVRIAHVPNVSSLIERKKQLIEQRKPYPSSKSQSSSNSVSKPNDNKTSSEKLSSMEVFALLKRQLTGNHEKITELESKVGVEALTLAYSWLYDNVEEAHEKAVELEKTVSNAAHQVITYRRALFLKIKNIADQAKEIEKNGRSAAFIFNTYSFTYGHNLYLCFAKFLMSEADLNMYGYPRPHPNPGCALISENVLRKDPPYFTDNKRVCEKCAEPYTVDEDGYPIEGIGKCIYHARKGFIRNRTNRHHEDVRHKCCRQEKGSPGCITSKYHASHNVDPTCLTGYIVLRDPPDDGEKENNVYALDCEMVFTTKGRELARLTIIDVKLRTVFDKLIKPKGVVLDCITQWSGITESDLKTATITFEEVQRYLKKTFNSKTILVGHGLENDLRSMKVLHEKIVDTSVVFPHKYAPQMKESLQRLAEQFLQKLIQTGEETLGHSSEEDAKTCMELMLMKIKEDCKQYAPKKVVNLNISRR